MVAVPFRPAAGPHTGSAVLAELARLWDQAQHRTAGNGRRLTQARLARESGVPSATVGSWATGTALPREAGPAEAVGAVLARWAGEDSPALKEWEQLLEADQAARPPRAPAPAGPGRLVSELDDPFALEVHRPVDAVSGGQNLGILPPYIRRDHDDNLANVVAVAAGGRSAITVLVGGSSTGKTRACWEAVHELPAGWRLWHPFDPTRPEALLAQLPEVGARTVVWLNETQFYLAASGETGERVAAALRSLLADPTRAPVLILGTMWPQYWHTLTGPGDDHAQARMVLDGTGITVPSAFTGPALVGLMHAAAADPRLAAAAGARDGQVTQYLAGVPVLLDRYHNAPPEARAVINAAMDARRLGHGIALPHAWLEAAAPAYLTDTEWDALGEDWLEQALAYTAAPCKGVTGPLMRIRPRPGVDAHKAGLAQASGGPVYRLADYLDQHARRYRAGLVPPEGFWTAASYYAHPRDQSALSDAAKHEGLYRVAAQLYKDAGTATGDPHIAARLVNLMRDLHPHDFRAAQWAADCVSLGDPSAVDMLLGTLRKAGADQQVATLAERAVAGALLPDPQALAKLLGILRKAGADQQVATLAERAAADTALDDPDAVAELLGSLHEAGVDQQVAVLADRAAASTPVRAPRAVAWLVDSMRRAGAEQQVAALADRAAAGTPLHDPDAVAKLLGSLHEAGADQQVTVLADRAAAGTPVRAPRAVAWLVDSMRRAGADQQVAALADRAAAGTPLHDPHAVGWLLESLHEAGADQQVTVLADRAVANALLGAPRAVAELLRSLRKAGADQQVTVLADRAAAGTPLHDPHAVGTLLDTLHEVGAHQEVMVLADRAASTSLDDPRVVAALLPCLQEAGADQQAVVLADRAATATPLDDSRAVAMLLRSLQGIGADQQLNVLAHRAASGTLLNDPHALSTLLKSLHGVGADQQFTFLADRAAADTPLDDPHAVVILLDILREADADHQVTVLADRAAVSTPLDDLHAVATLLADADQQVTVLADRAATSTPLDNARAVVMLLDILREARADQQVSVLAERAAASTPLDDPYAVAWLLDILRYAGADHQVTTLLARSPAACALLDDPRALSALLSSLRDVGADHQVTVLTDRAAAAGIAYDKPPARFMLVDSAPEDRVAQQAAEPLASDQAADAVHDDPTAAATPVHSPQRAGANLQFRFGREPNGAPAKIWGWDELN